MYSRLEDVTSSTIVSVQDLDDSSRSPSSGARSRSSSQQSDSGLVDSRKPTKVRVRPARIIHHFHHHVMGGGGGGPLTGSTNRIFIGILMFFTATTILWFLSVVNFQALTTPNNWSHAGQPEAAHYRAAASNPPTGQDPEPIKLPFNTHQQALQASQQHTLQNNHLDHQSSVVYEETDESYILNSRQLCRTDDGGQSQLLIMVISKPDNFAVRQAIRETWGNAQELNRRRVSIGFLLGGLDPLPEMSSASALSFTASKSDRAAAARRRDLQYTAKRLIAEHEEYGDLIQDNSYRDSYRNLTLKSLSMVRWVSTYCPGLPALLKADDDMFINVDRLISLLSESSSLQTAPSVIKEVPGIYGVLFINAPVIRDPKNKWFVSKAQYSRPRFPKYVSGTSYLILQSRPTFSSDTSLHSVNHHSHSSSLATHSDNLTTGPQAGGPNRSEVVFDSSASSDTLKAGPHQRSETVSTQDSVYSQLYKASARVKPVLEMEDVYLTGLLAQKANIPRLSGGSGFHFTKITATDICSYWRAVTVHQVTTPEKRAVWAALNSLKANPVAAQYQCRSSPSGSKTPVKS